MCRVGDCEIYYEIKGEGWPIFNLHGFTLDHRSMIGCMEPIFENRDGWKRIYLDLPGHGQTNGGNSVRNSEDVLRLLLDFIDVMTPETRFVIAGLSYGGYLARAITHLRPKQVNGLLLIVPGMVPLPENRTLPERTVFVKDEHLLKSLSAEEREEFESVSVIQTEDQWRRYKEEITVGSQLADRQYLERFDTTDDIFSFEQDMLSTSFGNPTLFLVGRQDQVVGYQDAWKVLENYPRASFAVLDRTGHALPLEQSQLFNGLVNEWLDRVESSMD